MSALRVAERVAKGGHDVPVDDIRRRFSKSLANLLELYAPAVDAARCLMNVESQPVLVFHQQGAQRTVAHPAYYDLIEQQTAADQP